MNAPRSAALVILVWLFSCVAAAPQNCPLPPSLLPVPKDQNIFSDAQEVDLGDAMAEAIELHINIIQDERINSHLREIGDRLIQHLPPTQLKFRFFLIDMPVVNAFSIGGGRVYIPRKLVVFSRNDDELAGVLAHELGHIVTHQTAIEMTRRFREVLGVSQVGDREDIFRKFHAYVENEARHPERTRGEEEHEIVADQVALYAIARAGFSPQSYADLWDRVAELHGRTGSWFSDMFGATTTEQRRLRDIIKNMAALPPGCTDRPLKTDDISFKNWQAEVVNYSDTQHSESVAGLIYKHKLSQPLRPDINNLRFSPDGKYILAQDEGGIHVASRNPFLVLFYIPAPDARTAFFSTDSRSVIFHNSGLRIEVWSVSEQKRTSMHEVAPRVPCEQTELSPDGGMLACLNSEDALLLIDVASNSVVHESKSFYIPTFVDILRRLAEEMDADVDGLDLITMGFSPDGRYFLAGHGTNHLAYDLINHREVSVAGSVKNLTNLSFAFLGPDRIVGVNPGSPEKSPVLRFPSGERLAEIRLGPGVKLRSATHGDYLFVGPLKEYDLGIMDLAAKEIRIAFKHNAADMYDGVYVGERSNGQLALYNKEDQQAHLLQLPQADLGPLRAMAVSGNLGHLAISTRTRGAVWDVEHDRRVFYTRGFHAAAFDGPVMSADFPKFQDSPRKVAMMSIITARIEAREIKEEFAVQRGLYLVVTKPPCRNSMSRRKGDIEVQDVRSGKVLWARPYKNAPPSMSFHPQDATAVLSWSLRDTAGRDELQNFPALRPRAERDDYFCEVLDADSGRTLSPLVVKTNKGSLQHLRFSANRSWAVAAADGDQVVTYALPSGEEKGHFFGSNPVLSTSGLLALEGEKREIDLYNVASSREQQRRYLFADPVAFKAFSADEKRLLVLTSSQTVYLLDVTAAPGETAQKAAADPNR